MSANATLALTAFLAVSSFLLLLFLLVSGRRSAVDARLDDDRSDQSSTPDTENRQF